MATDSRRRVALITGITGQVKLTFHALLTYLLYCIKYLIFLIYYCFKLYKEILFYFNIKQTTNNFFQDGSYLAEFLLEKGYDVHGIIRRASSFNTARIQHLYEDPKCHRQGKMKLHYGDMTDSSSLIKVISSVQPTEIYNLAAQSHVMVNIKFNNFK